jgi:phage shock protein A
LGIFSRLKNGIRSKANAAIDKAVDPERELEMAILELEEQRKQAIKELLAYKTTSKQMEQDMARYKDKAKAWESRAMEAVKKGDDDLARKALKEKKLAQIEYAKIKRDRDEAAGYAVELNNSRKKAETKLKILKLKKGTMATQIAVARSGGDNAFGHDDEVWRRFERAEEMIDDEAIQAEVDAALNGEEVDGAPRPVAGAESDTPLLGGGSDPDLALARLKADMEATSKAKRARAKELTAGDDDSEKPTE